MVYPGDFSLTLREEIDRKLKIQEMDDNLKFLNNLALSGGSGGSGTSGVSGSSGTSGVSGSSGTSGVSGSSGTSGTSGVSGTSGTSGSSGTSGTRGTSGTSGVSGSSGTSGTSGVSGTNGIGFTFRGSWNNSYTYYINEVVEYQGSSYTVIGNSVGYPPPNYPGYWALSAARGATGPAGLPEGYAVTTGPNTFNGDQTIDGLIINERSLSGIHEIGSTQNGMMVGPLELAGQINIADGGIFIII